MNLDQVDDKSEEWLQRLNSGDERAFEFLWNRFFRKMVAIAKQRIPQTHRGVRDEEDIALSAFKSFCLGFKAGDYVETQSVDCIWPLLVRITINKANDHLRRNLRQKRDSSRNVQISPTDLEALAIEDDACGLDTAANEIIASLIDSIQKTGDHDLMLIVLNTLQGEPPSEIAKRMECSIRTVQRKLQTIRRIWETMVE